MRHRRLKGYIQECPQNAVTPSLISNPANTKHLYNMFTTSAQRLERWSSIIRMLYKWVVFTVKQLQPLGLI